ncbi:MAG: beta-lactamase family protein [Acidobacteria bacterium]|nr:beta-lactamase family protein [Acidobacteriota bacterium]
MNVPFSRPLRFVGALAVVVAVALLSPVSRIRGAEDDTLPRASPEDVGMSSERLQRVGALMQRHIEENLLAGTVSLIARHGKVVHLEAQGFRDKDAGVPMGTDTIFTIMSMTKPIVTVALMSLFEEGHFLLDDPISKWLPAYADKTVRRAGGARTVSEPAARPVTVRHVLSHTSGLSIRPPAPPRGGQARTRPATLAEAVDRAADVPLAFHPGDEWQYGASTDYVAILVEKISGMSLDDFLRERIFEPLGMQDTYYNIPESKVDQVAAVYRPSGPGNTIALFRAPSYREPTQYFGGQAGLSSTAADYFRFHQMMLNGGELDGARILSPRTINLMVTNHIGDKLVYIRGPGYGFGLGYGIVMDSGLANDHLSPGSFLWGGAWGTVAWVDPVEDILGVLMMQITSYRHLTVRQDFSTVTSQAIIETNRHNPPTVMGYKSVY